MSIDALPEFIRFSDFLSGNQLAQLASCAACQTYDPEFIDPRTKALLSYMKGEALSRKLHEYARELMDQNRMKDAWQVLLSHPQHHQEIISKNG